MLAQLRSFYVGDKAQLRSAYYVEPAGGGAPGWVCVTGGTPGTWKAMASLAP